MTVQAEGPSPVAVQPSFELRDAGGAVADSGEIAVGEEARFDLEDGSYSFELTAAPVLEDGTTFELPGEPLAIVVSESMEDASFEIELEPIEVSDMTREQLEAVADELESAGATAAAASALEAAASAPSVSGGAEKVARDPAPAPAAPSAQGPSQEASEPSQPSHTHSWVAQTSQQWVPNQVWVVDQPAWDEQIPYSVWKCLKCGFTCYSADEMTAHKKQYALQGDLSHNNTVLTEYNVVHHDEAGHYEDQGHYETVTSGFVCPGCGATK